MIFSKAILTLKGNALMAKALSGEIINFTKIKVSDVTHTDIENLTSITGVKQSIDISKVSMINESTTSVLSVLANNALENGYYLKTFGIFALDPDEGEILYAVSTTTESDYFPAYTEGAASSIILDFQISTGNSANVTLMPSSSAIVSTEQLMGEVEKLLPKSGGVMTGPIKVPKIVLNGADVEEELGKGVKKLGDTMMGPLVFNRGSYAVRNYKDVFHVQINGYVTGVLKIIMPNSWTDTMFSGKIRGFNYTTNSNWELEFSGYNYVSGQSWYQQSAKVNGECPFNSVRFAHDGSKCCILLGDISTKWQYPAVAITEFMASNNNVHIWETGWDMVWLDSETGITKIANAFLKGKKYNSYESLGITKSIETVTLAEIASAMVNDSEANFYINGNANFPYNYTELIVKISSAREIAHFTAINRSPNVEAQISTVEYFYASGGLTGGWKPIAYAIAPTETIIKSGFLIGWSGEMRFGKTQEGLKYLTLLNMTKTGSDISVNGETVMTVPSFGASHDITESSFGAFSPQSGTLLGANVGISIGTLGQITIFNFGSVTTNVRSLRNKTIFYK